MAYASNLDLRARLKRAISGLSARFPEARHLVGKKLLVSEEAFAITEKTNQKRKGNSIVMRHCFARRKRLTSRFPFSTIKRNSSCRGSTFPSI